MPRLTYWVMWHVAKEQMSLIVIVSLWGTVPARGRLVSQELARSRHAPCSYDLTRGDRRGGEGDVCAICKAIHVEVNFTNAFGWKASQGHSFKLTDKNKHVYWGTVCSKCNFSLTNYYPNIFATANLSRMNVRIYSAVYIFTNECANIFIHFVYWQMNVQIYSNNKYLPNILTNEYKWKVKMI